MRPLRFFTWTVRILLALGFVPVGLYKVLNYRFGMGPSTGEFGVMMSSIYEAGFLYEFMGLAQLFAGLLLLVPRLATLGAMMYLPVISGIEVITTTMAFHNTWIITSLMLLGTVYLLCWDWPKLRPVLGIRQAYAADVAGGGVGDVRNTGAGV